MKSLARMRRTLALGTIALVAGCTAMPAKNTPDPSSPREKAKLYTEMGTDALGRGDYPQAVEDLRKAITADSNNAIAHNHLGLAYYALGRKELGKKEIKEALQIDPLYSDAHVNLGNFAAGMGDLEGAKKEYRQALDNLEYKQRHRALTSLANLELRQGNTDGARTLLYQSLQVNPDYCMSHYLLGNIFMKDRNTSRAADEFKQSVKGTCASNLDGHLNLGLSYMQLKQYDKARNSFMILIEQFPGSLQAQKAGDLLKDIP